MSKINERQVALRKGGNYTNLDNFFDRLRVTRAPFNETQTLSGLSASTGAVIPASLIPANANIPDNLKISLGAANTAAAQGGIVAKVGVNFDTAGTFAHDTEVLTDHYGNVLNAVEIRYEASHDPVTDNLGRKVFGLIIAVAALTDDTTVAANPNENLEICFVVNDGTGTLVVPSGGVTGAIEFNFNRVFAERNQAAVSLEGGSMTDVDVIADVTAAHRSTYTVTTGTSAADSELTLSDGSLTNSGASTRGGDGTAITMPDQAAFDNNSCEVFLNGVKQTKSTGAIGTYDSAYHDAGIIIIAAILDIGDVIEVMRKY